MYSKIRTGHREWSHSDVDLTLLQKGVAQTAVLRSEVYPGLTKLSKMEGFAVIVNGF